MIIDCESCTMRGDACTDCVVTFLTIPVGPPVPSRVPPLAAMRNEGSGAAVRDAAVPDAVVPRTAVPAGPVELDEAEQQAIGLLARSGLVPPLRMVRAV
jgi:hypothetical protein